MYFFQLHLIPSNDQPTDCSQSLHYPASGLLFYWWSTTRPSSPATAFIVCKFWQRISTCYKNRLRVLKLIKKAVEQLIDTQTYNLQIHSKIHGVNILKGNILPQFICLIWNSCIMTIFMNSTG